MCALALLNASLTFRNVFRGKVPRYLRSPLSCDIFITIAHRPSPVVRRVSFVRPVIVRR